MKEKLLLGGIGGLMPLIASFIVLDAETIASYIEHFNDPNKRGMILLCGYFLKAFLMFSTGSLWAYLHNSEESLLKIFQLGIVAPAIISGFIQSGNIKDLREKYHIYDKPQKTTQNIVFVKTAFAEENKDKQSDQKTKDEKLESTLKDFLTVLMIGFLTQKLSESVTGHAIDYTKDRNYNALLIFSLQNAYQKCLDREIGENDDLYKQMDNMAKLGPIKFTQNLCFSKEGQSKGCKFVNSECTR